MAFESNNNNFPSVQTAPHNPQSQNNPQNNVSPELFRQGVLEHAVWLGMDLEVDKQYLWIAERSLVAPLPDGWKQLKTDSEGECVAILLTHSPPSLTHSLTHPTNPTIVSGHPYYYNDYTGESRWDHPSDDEYRSLFEKKKSERNGTILSPRLSALSSSNNNKPSSPQAWGEQAPNPTNNPFLDTPHTSGVPHVATQASQAPITTPAAAPVMSPMSMGTEFDAVTMNSKTTSATNDVSKLNRLNTRLKAERDSALSNNEQLKEEIEEEVSSFRLKRAVSKVLTCTWRALLDCP